jgi:hypothetical protein
MTKPRYFTVQAGISDFCWRLTAEPPAPPRILCAGRPIPDHNPRPYDGPPRWLASARAPDLPVADLVVGRVTRNEKAPATWTVLELNEARGYSRPS